MWLSMGVRISMINKTLLIAFILFPVLTHDNFVRRFVEINSNAGDIYLSTNDHVICDELFKWQEKINKDAKIFIYKSPMFFYAVTGRTNLMYQTVLLQGFEYVENDKYQLLDNLLHCNIILVAKYTDDYEMCNGISVDNTLTWDKAFPDDFKFLKPFIESHFEPSEDAPYGYWRWNRKYE